MSRALFNRNADLKRLRDEGYFVQIRGGLLVMREVPYVDARAARAHGHAGLEPHPGRVT